MNNFQASLVIGGWGIFSKVALRCMPRDFTYNNSTELCHHITSPGHNELIYLVHGLSQSNATLCSQDVALMYNPTRLTSDSQINLFVLFSYRVYSNRSTSAELAPEKFPHYSTHLITTNIPSYKKQINSCVCPFQCNLNVTDDIKYQRPYG